MNEPVHPQRNVELLGVYVNDHLAAATGGIELVGRMLGVHRGSRWEPPLEQLLTELRDERAALLRVTRAVGIPVRQYKQLGVWLAEKVSRAKLNGRLLSRSPLSDLVEFEFLASAVRGKRSGFETLRIVAEVDQRLDRAELDRLIDQAHRQYEWLTEARREVAAEVFGGRPAAAGEAVAD
ncbi:hypothetical protein SAMN05660359_00039 [Geodermatophilus obscurus]|uniref:Uncharacterized protein n=1 Tax=Geodermatophilus obscurus TaxID=1861 RepID=A0A1I5C2I0_9ACTN|nr:hypothetical protein [Geodermatophilus obscurus]SFN81012.1 hypothetical protein SAMN05660359_00039 [Geodermatophilus obscurus]